MTYKRPANEGFYTIMICNGGDRIKIAEWCRLLTDESGIEFRRSEYIGYRCIDCEKPFDEVEELILQYADRFPMMSKVGRRDYLVHCLPVKMMSVEGYELASCRDESPAGMRFGEAFREAYAEAHGVEHLLPVTPKYPTQLTYKNSLCCMSTRNLLSRMWEQDLTDEERDEILELVKVSGHCSYDEWYRNVSPSITKWRTTTKRRLDLMELENG